LTEELTAIGLAKTSFDLVEQVEPIQGILDSSVIRKIFNDLQYLSLRFHDNSNLPLHTSTELGSPFRYLTN